MTERLFVGGPAHGRWIAVPDGEILTQVPEPARPTLWTEGDALYPSLKVHTYHWEQVVVFRQVIRVMVDSAMIEEERRWRLIELLLSSDAKALIQ